jgi:hypothetical protein
VQVVQVVQVVQAVGCRVGHLCWMKFI